MPVKLTKASIYSGNTNAIDLPLTNEEFEEAFAKWQDGMLIQDAFPTLSADQREFIMTGSTHSEWEEMWAEDKE